MPSHKKHKKQEPVDFSGKPDDAVLETDPLSPDHIKTPVEVPLRPESTPPAIIISTPVSYGSTTPQFAPTTTSSAAESPAVVAPPLLTPETPGTSTYYGKRIKMSSLIPKLRQHSLRPLLLKTLRAAVMSAIYAAIGRLILGISKSILKSGLSGKKFLKLATREIFTANPFKWGTVAAGLSCYRLLQQLVLRSSPHMPVPVSCAIGGGLASLPLMVLNVETRTEVGLYLGVRAIHGAICSEWNKIPMPAALRNFDEWTVVYMILLAFEILYTFSFYPETHSPSYISFMNSNIKQHPDIMHCLAALFRRQHSPYFKKMYEMLGVNVVTQEYAAMAAEGVGGCCIKPGARVMNVNNLKEACLFMHNYTGSCIYHYLSLSARHFATISLPLYLPLKFSTTLLFGWKKFATRPVSTIRKIITSSLQSSAFLTLYACVPHLALCAAANMQMHSPVWVCALASISGLSTILEPKNRRVDLALYCSLHGLRSFVNMLHVKGIIPKPTRQWIFWLQTIAIATLFYQYDEKYDYIHPNVQNACSWFLKEKRRSKEEIQRALEWQKEQDELKATLLASLGDNVSEDLKPVGAAIEGSIADSTSQLFFSPTGTTPVPPMPASGVDLSFGASLAENNGDVPFPTAILPAAVTSLSEHNNSKTGSSLSHQTKRE